MTSSPRYHRHNIRRARSHIRAALFASVATAGGLALLAACGGSDAPSPLCAPGSTQLCNGPGRCEGAQVCAADGQSYGACECGSGGASGTPNGGAGGDSNGGSSGDGGNGGTGGGAGGTSGGVGGTSGGTGGTGPSCDPKKTPDDGGCLTDVVYASPLAAAGGNGTKAKPYASLSAAIATAGTGKKRVVACADDSKAFAESVEVTADGVTVWGGFDCGSWSYQSGKKSKVASPTALGMKVGKVKLTLVDLEVVASDGAAAGDSSVGLFASESTGLTLRRVKVTAGAGKAGAAGTKTDFVFPTTVGLQAGAASGDVGGLGCEVTCPDGVKSQGGKGGDIALVRDGGKGLPGTKENGETSVSGGSCVAATITAGDNAPASTNGAGASAPGQLTSSGWTTSRGGDGANGQPGQGGGGGAAYFKSAGSKGGGGGGGCGTCGGAGAKGGQSGGSSIALMSFGSVVTLENSELVAVSAGGAGGGVGGQVAQETLLNADQAAGAIPGCNGGSGGLGASGGASGGGAGGHSVGLLFSGTAPTVDAESKLTAGTAGKGAAGGAAAGSADDGADGQSAKQLEL